MAEPFIFSNGQVAHNAKDLIQLCQQSPDDSISYLMQEDFEKWLSSIGEPKIAQYATKARQASVSDGQKLNLFITKSQAKTKPTFFIAIAVFFLVLFDRKTQTNN